MKWSLVRWVQVLITSCPQHAVAACHLKAYRATIGSQATGSRGVFLRWFNRKLYSNPTESDHLTSKRGVNMMIGILAQHVLRDIFVLCNCSLCNIRYDRMGNNSRYSFKIGATLVVFPHFVILWDSPIGNNDWWPNYLSVAPFTNTV